MVMCMFMLFLYGRITKRDETHCSNCCIREREHERIARARLGEQYVLHLLHSYIYTHIHTTTRTYIWIYPYIHKYIHKCIHTITHTHTWIYPYIHIYIYIYTCMHTYMHAYIYTHIYLLIIIQINQGFSRPAIDFMNKTNKIDPFSIRN